VKLNQTYRLLRRIGMAVVIANLNRLTSEQVFSCVVSPQAGGPPLVNLNVPAVIQATLFTLLKLIIETVHSFDVLECPA
jgi:hypothetical protein